VSHAAEEKILALAADGFHSSQAVYQQELQHLERSVYLEFFPSYGILSFSLLTV